jgi:aspartyl protease family protein
VSRLFWIVLIGLAVVAVIVIVQQDDGTVGPLSTHEFGSLAYQLAFAAIVGTGVLVMFRERFAQALKAILLWVAIGLVLAVGYTYRLELKEVSDRVLAELIPGRATQRAERNVVIVRGMAGVFQVAARINGSRVAMVLDTGACAVVLTHDAAKAAGLPLEVLNYDVNVDTANGRARAASVTLDRLAVGDIVERSVPALIAQPGQLRTSLLGMSFLNRLESWEVRGDRLMMRGYR